MWSYIFGAFRHGNRKSLVIIPAVHFMLMDPLVRYCLHQAGGGQHYGIGPIYASPPFFQRGYGIGSFLAGLWRVVRPALWSGAKNFGRETLRTGGDILTHIARSTDEDPRDIVSRRLSETAQNLIGKLRVRIRKRRAGVVKRKKITGG